MFFLNFKNWLQCIFMLTGSSLIYSLVGVFIAYLYYTNTQNLILTCSIASLNLLILPCAGGLDRGYRYFRRRNINNVLSKMALLFDRILIIIMILSTLIVTKYIFAVGFSKLNIAFLCFNFLPIITIFLFSASDVFCSIKNNKRNGTLK